MNVEKSRPCFMHQSQVPKLNLEMQMSVKSRWWNYGSFSASSYHVLLSPRTCPLNFYVRHRRIMEAIYSV